MAVRKRMTGHVGATGQVGKAQRQLVSAEEKLRFRENQKMCRSGDAFGTGFKGARRVTYDTSTVVGVGGSQFRASLIRASGVRPRL